jgi:predicted hydrocarbon binding protein
MNQIKYWEIGKLEKFINKKVQKKDFTSKTLGRIISILGKHLIKMQGYSILSTVLRREIREIGKRDAKFLKEVLNIDTSETNDIKLIINAAALLFGIKLKVENERVIAVKCPFHEALSEFKEPFMCNACVEYNKGITEELTNDNFTVERTKWLFEDGYCVFQPVRKS